MNSLDRGCDVVVGTPGRVFDLFEKGALSFAGIQTVVLDEADHMLDIGFAEDMDKILASINTASNKKPQVLLFSATLPEWIHRNAQKYQSADRIYIDAIGNVTNRTAERIRHLAVPCDGMNLGEALSSLLSFYANGGKAMIFAETKLQVEQLNESIKFAGGCGSLHGDLTQAFREKTLARFRSGQINCLIATDVAARGLDIPDVDIVIQMEPPRHIESFIHRAGRTARAGKEGTCLVMFNPRKDLRNLVAIEKEAGMKFQKVGFPPASSIINNQFSSLLAKVNESEKRQSTEVKSLASRILEHFEGDSVKVIGGLIASMSGAMGVHSRSFFNGSAGMKTLVFKTKSPIAMEKIVSLLKSNIPDLTLTQYSRIVDENGIAFDIRADQMQKVQDAFLNNPKLSSVGTLEDSEIIPDLEFYSKSAFSSGGFSRGASSGGGYRGNFSRGGSRNDSFRSNNSFSRGDNDYGRGRFTQDRIGVRSSYDGRDSRGNQMGSSEYNKHKNTQRKIHVPFI